MPKGFTFNRPGYLRKKVNIEILFTFGRIYLFTNRVIVHSGWFEFSLNFE